MVKLETFIKQTLGYTAIIKNFINKMNLDKNTSS